MTGIPINPGSPAFVDRTGHRYGRLVVQSFHSRERSAVRWNCLCDCGNTKVILGNNLRSGISKSCGCGQAIRRQEAREAKALRVITETILHEFARQSDETGHHFDRSRIEAGRLIRVYEGQTAADFQADGTFDSDKIAKAVLEALKNAGVKL